MSLFINPMPFYNDSKGRTLGKARMWFYEDESYDTKDTYSDSDLTSVNSNPVVSDDAGRFPQIFLADGGYRVVLQEFEKPDNYTTIYVWDGVFGGQTSSEAVTKVDSIAELEDLAGVNGQVIKLTAEGRLGDFIANTEDDLSTEVAADTQQGIYVQGDDCVWVRDVSKFEVDELYAEWFGAKTDGAAVAILAAVDILPSNGGTIRFFGNYNGIDQDIQILRNKVTIKGTGANRLIFDSGYGLILGDAPLTDADKSNGTKVITIRLEDFHVTGETNYAGILTDFAYADLVSTVNFNSSPISISSASGSECIGLRVSWVQWWNDYNGYFGGNKAGVYWNFTNHGQDNEDHFHWYGTRCYLQKGLITGVSCAASYVFFEDGRVSGASEASFEAHFGEFVDSGSDLADAYGWVVDLDGTTSDRKPFRSPAFNSCMTEQFPTMFDLTTLNSAGTGKDISVYTFNESYFVGNSFATNYLFRADDNKGFAVFQSCEASSIDTLFDDIRCRFEGRNDFTNYNTFSTDSYSTHDFVGMRPIAAFKTEDLLTETVLTGTTELAVAHGLVDAPNWVEVAMVSYETTWWINSIDSTNINLRFGTAPTSDKTIYVKAEIVSNQ